MRTWIITGVASLMAVAGPVAAAAQEPPVAQTFDQLQVLVKVDDTLTVTDEQGREIRGRLLGLSNSLLVLGVDGARTELTQDRVRTIRHRHSDSLKNGALWGLVGGLVCATTQLAVSEAFSEGEDPELAALAAAFGFYAAAGTGVGVGIDALIRRNRVVYARPPSSTIGRLSVSPVITPVRRAVAVAWTF